MQETALAYRTYLTVTEETCQPQRSEPLLHKLSIMVGAAKHPLAASVATAQAASINRRVLQLAAGSGQQFVHVFRCRRG